MTHYESPDPPLTMNNILIFYAASFLTEGVTLLWTDEGWLYLAAIIDVGIRRIVGWSMQDNMRTDLVVDGLEMAHKHRRPGRGVVHHSDRGCQYASEDYRRKLWIQFLMIGNMNRALFQRG